MKVSSRLALIAAAIGLSFTVSAESQAANGYGCFKVTASSLNIRARPYASAEIIGTASKGEILIKRKPQHAARVLVRGAQGRSRRLCRQSQYAEARRLSVMCCPSSD